MRALDAGCGAGRTAVWLAEQGAAVTGIDASPEMIARARKRVPAASFAVADLAEPLPFGDGAFDLAVASLVMHYLRYWVPTLRDLRRVLRPDGVFAFTAHHPLMDVQFWRRPLSETFRAIAEGGFRVDLISEPQPLPEVRGRFPDAWERLSCRPQFLFLRLIAR